MRTPSIRRFVTVPIGLLLLAGLLVVAPAPFSTATPVAVDDATYQLYGRVFPDPHGCMPRMAPFSPFAQGKVCAVDFIQFDEMVAGMGFLQEKFPGFIDAFRIDERFGNPDYMSAGLATADMSHEPNPLWIVRVTDESVPDDNKKHFIFPLSIHAIERAGAEGGIRAIEDLVTWGATEPTHPILESSRDVSMSAGEALKRSAVYFVFPNPDGWRRGDRNNGVFYQRYNGNGIDLNRDWPALGYVFEGYTPLSEPETKSLAEVIKEIRSKWDGGIDLHGQLIDVAFSFTMLGQGQHDYGKNQATLDIVQNAWRDAETRLGWSSLIKPNDAPADDPRVYGVQWGTVWDSIGYTVTGSFGDWINQPIGLDAVGIDNEMSLSHISNCGVGTCFIPEVEQLHVDGNKSLIYSMINFTFRPEDNRFAFAGRAAYLNNPRVLRNTSVLGFRSSLIGLKPQVDLELDLDPTNEWTSEFDVLGPSQKVLNGGMKVNVRALNVAAVSPAALASVVVERQVKGEEGLEWEVVNSYYNQSFLYLQSGQTIDVNDPEPGHWRVRVDGGEQGLLFHAIVDFSEGPAWKDPGQLPYEATNMHFFRDLNRYVATPLDGVNADAILAGTADLNRYDTLVLADTLLPGYEEPPRTGPAQATIELGPSDASNDITAGPPGVSYPCAGYQAADPTPGCTVQFAWDVDAAKNNQAMTVTLEWLKPNDVSADDFDMYVERYAVNGDYWTPVAQSAGGDNPEVATLLKPVPGHYRARVVNWASAEPVPQSLTVAFSNELVEAPRPSTRTAAELTSLAKRLRTFVEEGGNLVLTDGAIRLLASMGLFPRTAINEFAGFAGFIGFTPDGAKTTYDLPLAKNVQRPGAAEGAFHRHQTYDPGVVGFDIGEDNARNNTAPIWAVDQTTWQKAGGITAGTSTGDLVTLGELKVGKGVVRIIGAMLPFPTDRYYHPFGLGSYAVTYSGYQVLQNALNYTAAARTPTQVLGGQTKPKPALPATGVGTPVAGAVALMLSAFAIRFWRRRVV